MNFLINKAEISTTSGDISLNPFRKIYNVDLLLKYEGEAVEKVTFSGDPSHLKEYYGFEKKITFAEGIESWKKRNLE